MRMKLTFVLSIFLLFLKVEAQHFEQNMLIDSLKNVIELQDNTEKFNSIMKLVDIYTNINVDSAETWIKRNIDLAKKMNDKKLFGKAYKSYGLFYNKEGKYHFAEYYMKKAIELERSEALEDELAESYRWLAGIYFNLGLYNKSINYLDKSLIIFEKNKNYSGVVSCYNNLGILEKSLKRYQKAINHYKKALEIISNKNLQYDPSALYTNLGVSYRYLKQFDSSYYFMKKSLKHDMLKKEPDINVLAKNYLNLAKLFMDSGENDSIIKYFDKLMAIYPAINPSFQPTVLTTIGKWYYKNGNYDKAVKLLREAYHIGVKNSSLRDKEYALYYLYMSYKQQKEPDSALLFLERLVDVQDSVDLKEAKVKMEQLKEKFENEKKQIKIEQLEKIKMLDQRIKYLLYLIIAGISVTSYYLISSLIKQRIRSRQEKERIENDLVLKNKQLASQALAMMQKNALLNEILLSLNSIKTINNLNKKEVNDLRRKVKRGIQSEKDWELFRQYFEMVNKDFFIRLKEINPAIRPSELKLAALTKLHFSIKEAATLLNISPDSVKSSRSVLRKKLGLKRGENLYEFLNSL